MKNIRQNLCRDRIFSYRDTDYYNLEKSVETERIRRRKTSLTTGYEEVLLRQGMNVATLKDKIFGPDRETKSRQAMLT